MPIQNFEFKARSTNLRQQEQALGAFNPRFIGTDYQCDTYFNVSQGRLKLREGNIENALIYYERNDVAGAKSSAVQLFKYSADSSLKSILTAALGIKIIVEKERRIWFIENVKFHFDTVSHLGEFIEVEAIDEDGSIGMERLKEQCDFYANFLKVPPSDFVAESYSDLLLIKTNGSGWR